MNIKVAKFTFILALVSSAMAVTSCDLRSETAKKDMEKFASTPLPIFSPTPEPTPVDPADIIKVDTSLEGESIPITGHKKTQTAVCKKYDRVMVNGDEGVITINGACRQIMINGDGNEIKADAATEIVLNGTNNTVTYSRYINGKQPLIAENQLGNVIGKVAAGPVTKNAAKRKIEK